MGFRKAVNATEEVSACLQTGKSALGADAAKIAETDPRQLEGSIDMDNCLKGRYPTDNRWDFAIGYKGKAYFVEVHPATTSEVETMIKKLNWLRNWLRNKAPELEAITAPDPYHWVFTNKSAISTRSTYGLRLQKAGLSMPKRQLVLK